MIEINTLKGMYQFIVRLDVGEALAQPGAVSEAFGVPGCVSAKCSERWPFAHPLSEELGVPKQDTHNLCEGGWVARFLALKDVRQVSK